MTQPNRKDAEALASGDPLPAHRLPGEAATELVSTPANSVLQVLTPQLPTADRLLPYLRRIDETRIYSNWGPLTAEFEQRLAERLGLPGGGVTSASSGTAAIAAAILATAGRGRAGRPLAVLPGLTFVATAAAAEQCGYQPYLVDPSLETWALDPESLAKHPVLSRTGVVVVVSPYGRPVPQTSWRAFRERTGVPVVIDGAASFDRLDSARRPELGDVPVAISFHATKAFAAGEGGAVAASDSQLVLDCARALNFGFHMTRESVTPSFNGKLSEYHAAVALAELDGWSAKRRALQRVADAYRSGLAGAGLADRLAASPDISLSYVLFRCHGARETAAVRRCLTEARVDSRLWYGCGLHKHPYLARARRDALPVTEALAPSLVGVPLAPDLDRRAIRRVVTALAAGVRQNAVDGA